MERESFFHSPLFRKLAPWALCLASFSFGMSLLFSGRAMGLFPMPFPGTDQLSMLQAAAGLCCGLLPPEGYMYSPAYTLFLAALAKISYGDIFLMRVFQCAICSLIPVMIWKTGLSLRLGREASFAAALLYCLYGPAQLIALDFLRAAPLGLCFVCLVFFLSSGAMKRSLPRFLAAGFFGALCILGRENFIPVVFVPGLLLLWPGMWRRVGWRGVSCYLLALSLPVLAAMALNAFRFGQLSIIPGHVSNVMGAYHGSETAGLLSALPGVPLQMWKFVCSYEIPNSLSFYAHRDILSGLSALFVPFNALCALSLAAFGLGARRPGIWLLCLLAGAYAASMLFFEMFYRFRIPDVPLLALLAGFGLAALLRPSVNLKLRLAFAVLALAFLLATWQNAERLRPPGEMKSVAELLISNGRLEEAASQLAKMRDLGIDVSSLSAKLQAAAEKELMANSGGR